MLEAEKCSRVFGVYQQYIHAQMSWPDVNNDGNINYEKSAT
jgi:hypothetical protein